MQTKPSNPACATDPVAILLEEHRKIGLILDGLEAVAQAAAAGAFTNAALVREILWFLREFTDGRHHAKEEELLFPVLELMGLSREAGPTHGMRLEHVQGRKLVALLADMTAVDVDAREPDWQEIALAALAYVRLLRSHIQKENHCLFALADELLGQEEKAALAGAFLRVDREWTEAHGAEGDLRVEELLRAFNPLPYAC